MARLARVTMTSLEAAGVDVDELVRPDRLDNAVGRDRAAWCRDRANGRSAPWRPRPAFSTRSPMRTTSPVTMTLAVMPASARAPDPRPRREREQERESADAGADHGEHLSQRISCAVVCSIWSAAVMTLEFIS